MFSSQEWASPRVRQKKIADMWRVAEALMSPDQVLRSRAVRWYRGAWMRRLVAEARRIPHHEPTEPTE